MSNVNSTCHVLCVLAGSTTLRYVWNGERVDTIDEEALGAGGLTDAGAKCMGITSEQVNRARSHVKNCRVIKIWLFKF
jgi:hypothetical protein